MEVQPSLHNPLQLWINLPLFLLTSLHSSLHCLSTSLHPTHSSVTTIWFLPALLYPNCPSPAQHWLPTSQNNRYFPSSSHWPSLLCSSVAVTVPQTLYLQPPPPQILSPHNRRSSFHTHVVSHLPASLSAISSSWNALLTDCTIPSTIDNLWNSSWDIFSPWKPQNQSILR